MNRTRALLVAAACVLSLGAGAAQAQAMRVLVGYPPGGAVDPIGRLFAERLSEALGRPVIVENRAGASGQIAAMALKNAAPDGNTLMVCPDAVIVLSPHTVKTPLAYDTLADFAPVAHLGSYEYGLAVNAGVPASDLKGWIAWVRTDPKNGSYGTSGSGTGPQFMGVMLAQATGLSLQHVPYRGVGPATADLVGGQVPAVMLPYAQMLPLARSGKIRILAHSGGARAAAAPEIPTFKELGYPSMELSGWYGMFAPAGTPPQVLARYNEIILQALRMHSVRDRMRALDLGIQEMRPPEMAAMIKAQYEYWRPVVKSSGYSADAR